jgi:hypothetical protein
LKKAQLVALCGIALPEDASATIYITSLNLAVAIAMSEFGPAAIPEMVDRVIAATVRALNAPLLTTDLVIIESGLVKIVD